MPNSTDYNAPAETLGDLLNALTWCGWRIAQGLREDVGPPPPVPSPRLRDAS